MIDIVLDYGEEDRSLAERLAEAFAGLGWETGTQADWFKTQHSYYNRPQCVLAIWSDAAVKREMAFIDTRDAALRGSLVGVIAGPMDDWSRRSLPAAPVADLTRWQGDLDDPAFVKVKAALQRLGLTPSAAPLVRKKPKEARRKTSVLPGSGSGASASVKSPVREETPESTASALARLFLCYRRDDTADAAGRLRDKLAGSYGDDRVFMDIDSVPLGIDFVEHVREQISGCAAVIVMIGRRWLTLKDKRRRRRLDNEDDLVRAEIAAALTQKIPVIPVVVQNASMPIADDLPEDIRLLARRNGIQLRPEQWREGVERLLRELDPVMGKQRGR
jgi:TIR domain